jgi:hypothetical protein
LVAGRVNVLRVSAFVARAGSGGTGAWGQSAGDADEPGR